MIELNKTINWKPESTGSGRFGEMARKPERLEPEPLALLGHTAAYLAVGRG